MFNTFSNFISSTVNKISNPETTENYEYTSDFYNDFDHIIDKYHQKFEEKNFESNNIISCDIHLHEKKDNVILTKRVVVVNLVKLPISVPETLWQYVGNTEMSIEHITEINTYNKVANIKIKNISHPQFTFNEFVKIIGNNEKTTFNLVSSLAVNILIGVNETIRKLWLLHYKNHYESEKFKKKLIGN
jgi:hypothetical protein